MNENRNVIDTIEVIEQVDSDSDVVPVTSENQLTEETENNNTAVNISRRGAPVHSVWGYAFTDSNVHSHSMPNHAVCKHCKQSVRHHHKTLAVKNHLKKCRPFKKIMLYTAIVDRPDWWNETKGESASSSKASTSSKTTSQPSARSFAVPLFKPSEQKKFNHEIAMHFYNTGTSFQRVEDPFLLQAIQIARPGAKLPTRKQLADDSPGGLLEECYAKVKSQVDKQLSSNNNYVCITSDAWSNISNEPVVNYMAVSPINSLFLEAVNTGAQGHDANWLSKDLTRVIDSLHNNAVGAVTDNTATNKKVWKELEEKYPSLFFHGCASHGLHLLVKDVFGGKKAASTDNEPDDDPASYLFEDLQLFSIDCKDVVTFFHNHHAPKAKLKKALVAAKLKALVQPAPTRWGTLIECFKSLRAADSILSSLVAERDFVTAGGAKQKEKRAAIRAIVMDPDFVKKLDECIRILEPIEMFIKIFQNDAVPCSDVYKAFLVLEEKMGNLSKISSEKQEYLVNLVRNRFNFMYGDAHGVCYVLDPRYLGDNMTRALRNEIEDFIYNFPKNDGTTDKERQEQLAREYTAFRIEALRERQQKTFRFKLIGQSKSVLQWWKADGTDWPLLQDLATRVFSMASSSAASERNFSSFGFIHTKLRNRLCPEKVAKLVYIKTNTAQINGLDFDYDSDDSMDISGSEDVTQ